MNKLRKYKRDLYIRAGANQDDVMGVLKTRLAKKGYIKRKLTGDKIIKNTVNETVGGLCEKLGTQLPKDFKWATADQKITSVERGVTLTKKGGAFLIGRPNPEIYERNMQQAVDRGVAVIFADAEKVKSANIDISPYPVILVEDGMKKFAEYYRPYRDAYKGKVVGITGSLGKTTTRGYIKCVSEKRYSTFTSKSNLNSSHNVASNIINSATPAYKVFIQEIGASIKGSVAVSAEILHPDIAVVTNVREHHVNEYGSIENVFEDKIKLVELMTDGGTAVVNFDDDRLAAYDYKCNVASFGIETDRAVKYKGSNVVQNGDILKMDISYDGKTVHVSSEIKGEHNAYNMLAAFAVGKVLGISDDLIKKGIAEYRASGTRQNIVEYGRNTLFVDCYNVSNDTINDCMRTLEEIEVRDGGRRIAIIGGENKLGEMRVEKTRELGQAVAGAKVDEIVCFGSDRTDEEALDRFGDPQTLYDTIRECGNENVRLVKGFDNIVAYMEENIRPNDAVLFKCIVYLNMPVSIDKVFGTGFGLGLKETRKGREMKTIGGYKGFIMREMEEACLRDVTDKKLSAKKIVIPDEFDGRPVFAIGKGLFAFSDIEKLDLGHSVQHIAVGAFRGCRKLREVKIPDSVKYIREGAFRGCTNLERVVLGPNLVQIDRNAFADCRKLKDVVVPPEMDAVIDPEAFDIEI
ncbi:MAG: leucine-rich repeat protein [Firmicutes bacterium]|nr:leucine-rich repeat protein [Bacillota bacterium]